MRRELIAAVVAAAALTAERDAEACGPAFPIELLTQRDDTLLGLEEGVFAELVAELVPPPAFGFELDERDDARAVGGVEERILYDAGAFAFHGRRFEEAARLFEAVLALPPARRLHRSTWARYMLGRIHARAWRDADAIRAFAEVRALAIAGFRDDLALAVASLGEEARLRYRNDDDARALHRYAEQAAAGDPSGAYSLLEIARWGDGRLASDPVGRRVLAAFLYARSDELTDEEALARWEMLAASDSPVAAAELAAVAYRRGLWDLAGRLARRDPDAPLSRRVRAKLALRDGDTAAAERLLAGLEPAPRVCGERALIALAEERMPDAMEHAWQARDAYPLDAAYIAERVLTAAEAAAFADAHPDPELDELVARRSLRAGDPGQIARLLPHHLLPALAYTAGVERARRATDPIERARALYETSLVARRHGLEILGTEHAPDWGYYDAGYDLDDGYRFEDESTRFVPTDAERARVAASAPSRPERYHYRFLASELAERAADELPPRSQAFAMTLCVAARHIFHRDPDRVDALWWRYADEGASVSFDFGQQCDEPAFERARRYLPRRPRSRWPDALSIVLALAAAGITFAATRAHTRALAHV